MSSMLKEVKFPAASFFTRSGLKKGFRAATSILPPGIRARSDSDGGLIFTITTAFSSMSFLVVMLAPEAV
jgi:hypothetical protein